MTDIRAELSPKNKYWIEKHRYYELKHFCLQYLTWKRAYNAIDGTIPHPFEQMIFSKTNEIQDPVTRCVEAREIFLERIILVENCAKATDPELWDYILKAVTRELAYENLRTVYDLPCGREMWYQLYRKFFFILHNSRK